MKVWTTLPLIDAEARLKVLMLASLDGDAKAYRLLLETLGQGLRPYFRRRLTGADAADEEDLVQDTLIAMHTRRATYDPNLPLTAWVYAIARYKLIDHFRRRRIRRSIPLEDAGALFADDEAGAALARLDLDRMMETLPQRTRELIRRTKLDGPFQRRRRRGRRPDRNGDQGARASGPEGFDRTLREGRRSCGPMN